MRPQVQLTVKTSLAEIGRFTLYFFPLHSRGKFVVLPFLADRLQSDIGDILRRPYQRRSNDQSSDFIIGQKGEIDGLFPFDSCSRGIVGQDNANRLFIPTALS